MTVIAAIGREVSYCREAKLTVARVHVTVDAIPGSVVSVPLTPEHARLLGLVDYGRGVETDPRTDVFREIRIHPADYGELLTEKYAGGLWAVEQGADGIERVLGVKIAHA